MPRKAHSADQQFIERLGLLVEADGLPRIAGRIMGFLLVTPGPCRAADIAEHLQISHGSVSTNTRLLERLGVIERVTFPADRSAYFQLTQDPYGQLMEGVIQRARRMQATVAEHRATLPDNDPARRRLADMERFYRMLVRQMEDLQRRWKSDSAV